MQMMHTIGESLGTSSLFMDEALLRIHDFQLDKTSELGRLGEDDREFAKLGEDDRDLDDSGESGGVVDDELL